MSVIKLDGALIRAIRMPQNRQAINRKPVFSHGVGYILKTLLPRLRDLNAFATNINPDRVQIDGLFKLLNMDVVPLRSTTGSF